MPARHLDDDIKDAVPLINAFPQDKLSLLLRRILHSSDPPVCVFTAQEQSQLMAMGNMSASQVSTFLAGVTRILTTAGYHDWDDAQFTGEVTKLGLVETAASSLTLAWSQERSSYRAALLRASTTTPGHLPNVTESHWRLHVTIADSSSSGHAVPHALFHLQTTKDSPSPSSDIHMDMNHAELYDFFIQLDAIQAQVDALATPPP
ncbi:hypothetical protein H257_04929 [Aphanomyces astaci]|uniref:COMM domain-containing protein n=1 Tax=Aphanomyces astaci TaxID=112090 RepID=W4GSB5_APHAT|nr:hypothetical protein H257_04929 [Aphanomyces astaci]ETV82226.1 hypothetical protein H257_04929 [Aphanomyces astaci]|eukprot:XP_009827895.1 hypothetical protein H257_04929 [Aphanomyces astaci]